MPSNHLILCHLLPLPPSIFPSIRVFSNESVVHTRWPKYWSFSFSISPSNEYSGLISFRMDWFDLLAVQGLSRVFSNTMVQKNHSSVLGFLYSPTLTSIHDYWKNFCVRAIIYCLKYPLPPTSMGRTCSVNPWCWTWSCSLLVIVMGNVHFSAPSLRD